ncbi:MAG: EAL domain-containing protein [Bacillota bacterium]|nr:EAL domain-containing protein [Bacillota bacterium]
MNDWKYMDTGGGGHLPEVVKTVSPYAVDTFTDLYRHGDGVGGPLLVGVVSLTPDAVERMGPEVAGGFTAELAARLARALKGRASVTHLYPGSRELVLMATTGATETAGWRDSLAGAVARLCRGPALAAYAVRPGDVRVTGSEVRRQPGTDPAVVFDSVLHRLAGDVDGARAGGAEAEAETALAALQEALQGRGLRLARQPIVNLHDRSIYGYEVLIRGPQDSPLEQPDALFALAGEHAAARRLETVCRRTILRYQPADLADGRRLFLNVNPIASLRELVDVLHQRTYEPRHLVVEISEKSVFDHPSQLREELRMLRALGVEIALDDVGTGHTGLQVLALFQWDYIKIDATVTRRARIEPRFAALCSALKCYAAEVGARVIAEGIETADQYAFCRDRGLELGQGYLFGRPVLWR